MKLSIETRLAYDLGGPSDLLLQVELARAAGQEVLSDGLSTTHVEDFTRIAGEAGFGTRAWMGAEGRFEATYRAEVEVTRPDPDLAALGAVPPRRLTGEATGFTMPSRYCPSDAFSAFVAAEFTGLAGGTMVAAMRDWVADRISYVSGSSGPSTTAQDTFVLREGVCRDFAHLLITLVRAGGVPARMASVYAPRVTPPDFHAAAEVFLDGAWHLVDATGMAGGSEMALVGVGRDAADVSFLTVMGSAELVSQSVSVKRQDG
jgi:transglutaminase-like putative cysteine protease